MNVRCPECQAVFRVDPERVPVAGVRARCARCSAVFALSRSGVAAARPTAAVAAGSPPSSQPTTAPANPASRPAAPRPAPAQSPLSVPPAPPSAARSAPAAPAAPAPTPSAARSSFLKQDPNTRAQRLARALVSDIVAYNREKRDQMLAAGTLKNEFREEIRKSWEEYVAQVGLELARSTPFFRSALNEILAGGQQVF